MQSCHLRMRSHLGLMAFLQKSTRKTTIGLVRTYYWYTERPLLQILLVAMSMGIFKIITKGWLYKSLIKNWYPITLLNVSYKILAKVLALRLLDVLPTFISKSRSGFIRGRYIIENLITS